MKRALCLAVLIALMSALACGGCASGRTSDHGVAPSAAAPQTLRNGIYEVLGEAAIPPTNPLGTSHRVLAYDRRKYSQAPENEPLSYVTIDGNSFVPLILEGTPGLGTDPNGRSMLSITLARDQAKQLEDFSRAHLGGRVATILDGEIITLNKIRAVITGGEVQMTRCTDEACQFVRAKLVK